MKPISWYASSKKDYNPKMGIHGDDYRFGDMTYLAYYYFVINPLRKEMKLRNEQAKKYKQYRNYQMNFINLVDVSNVYTT